MKRPSRSFVVEVRRQRRPPGEPQPSWTEELQRPRSKPAARHAEPPPLPPVVETAPPNAPVRPAGRILPSLIESAPEAPTPVAPPKPAKARIQRRRAPAAAPQPVRFAEPPPAIVAAPPIAEPPSEAAGADRAERHRRILARYVFGGGLKPGQRWKRRLHGDAP